MLGKDYITLNGQKIPNPTGVSVSYTNIENVKQSEAGTDVGNVIKLTKRTINFSFSSTSRGRDKIKAYCRMSQITLTFNGEPMVGRLRIKSSNMVEGSEYAARTDGLWKLSVSFMENGED